jgi:hypothetical protein
MLTTSSNHFTERERSAGTSHSHGATTEAMPASPAFHRALSPRLHVTGGSRRDGGGITNWLLLYFPGPSSACCRISIWLPCLLHHSSFARVLAGRHVATEGLGSNRFRKQLEDGDRTCIHALLQIHSQELRPTEPVVAPVYVRIWLEDQSLRLVRA